MPYDVSIREVEPQSVLARHVIVKQVDLGRTIGQTFGEAYGFLGRVGIAPVGPPFVEYHNGPQTGSWAADICVPVAAVGPEAPDGYGFRIIDGGLVATTLHRGPYDTIAAAYRAVADWIPADGYEFVGPPREIYLSEPDVPPAELETIVEWPVKFVRVPAATAR